MKLYKKFKYLALLVFMMLSSSLYAQIKFEHLGVAEGLSQSTVLCILQDSKGFMWFCTEDGLNKYDGYKFTVYRHDADDTNSLSNNYVWDIYEDRMGVFWIATSNGLDKFDPRTEQFVHFRHNHKNPDSLNHNDVRAIYEDHYGTLWIGTYGGGLNQLDRATGKFKHYSLGNNKIYWSASIVEDHKGILWIGTEGSGLNKFDREKDIFVPYQHDASNPKSLADDIVEAIFVDNSGILWVGTGAGLDRFERETETFVHYPFEDEIKILSIFEDDLGRLWIGTDGDGLYEFDTKVNSFARHYGYSAKNPSGLSNNYINAIYQDNASTLWIATWGGGVNKVSQAKKFGLFQHENGNPNSLSGNSVWSIFEDSQGIWWIGTEGDGLNKFDRTTGKFVHYQNDEENSNSLISDDIYGIAEDKTGALWIGTWEGLEKFDPKTEDFVHYQHDDNNPNSLSNNNINAIYMDRSDTLWIGTWGYGLNKFDPQKKTFVHYKHDEKNPKSLSDDQVNELYVDRKGVLWVGTIAGLDKFDPKTESFIHYKHDDNNPKSLSSGQVYSIYEDSRGILWIGTAGGGLNKFYRKSGTFSHYRAKDGGIPNDTINQILEDELGNLWLSTNKGLSKFNPKTETFRNYDVSDGLQSNEFIWGSGSKTRSGELSFGGQNGFNIFKPNEIKNNPNIPPVVISDFYIFNSPVKIGADSSLKQHISFTKELTLSYKESVFSFEFVALNYTSSEKNQYAYKMDGVDKDWVYVDSSRRFVTYTNLDAGNYIFKVKASNNDGLWNEEGSAIKITITPPWWKTGWAYFLYSILILSLIFAYIIRQQKKLDREQAINEQLKQADKLKDELLANTSHELRTPLNGIIGIAESVRDGATGDLSAETKANLDMIVGSGKRLAKLVDDILDFSKLKENTLELQLKAVSLREIVDIVLTLSKPLIGNNKKIELINSVDAELPAAMADENRLQQIFHNLVANAIKFTETGHVEIKAEVINNELEISVYDTGIGIAEEKFERIFESFEQAEGSTAREYGGTGLGLAVTQQLVELHRGHIGVKSQEGVGSQFFFTIPVSKDKAESLISVDLSKVQASTAVEIVANEPSEVSTASTGELSILIVDDEPVNLQVLNNYLKNLYHIVQASSGKEALSKIENGFKPDAILLDVMMPQMTGYEVIDKLRENWQADELPILLLTAKTQIVDLVTGLQHGANDYLTKPISKNELLARLKTHLNLKLLKAETVRMGAELEVTRRIQQMLLPKTEELEKIVGLDIAGFMQPAEEVGGDYYDVLQYNGRVLFGIGDATGHGLESGMLALMTQAAVRALLENDEKNPAKFMNSLNAMIYKNVHERLSVEKNLTLSLLEYEQAKNGGILRVSGYHEDIIIVRQGELELIDTGYLGCPVGFLADMTDYVNQKELIFNQGDVLVLYTDGITEAANMENDEYGIERLCEVVKQHSQASASSIKDAVINDVQQYIGKQTVFDDITLLVLKQK